MLSLNYKNKCTFDVEQEIWFPQVQQFDLVCFEPVQPILGAWTRYSCQLPIFTLLFLAKSDKGSIKPLRQFDTIPGPLLPSLVALCEIDT